MAHRFDPQQETIEAFLARHERKTLLRFITCGSVDDGKSTLIGRLLYESGLVFDDQLEAVERDSARWGTQGARPDLALLVDGLAAEREQGITIDVAYRFFSTERRKFIVADTPGHEQYTRNMVTGASTADLAVILVDARKGVLTQTRRHTRLVALLGVPQVVLAVNKMDLVGWDEARFHAIVAEWRTLAESLGLGLQATTAIPMSALEGDNVIRASVHMPWYTGLPLLEHLETCAVDEGPRRHGPLRLPVQWVNRPNADFRGFSGLLASGRVRPGDAVRVLPAGQQSTVARVIVGLDDVAEAVAGQSVTLTLADEVDCSRGTLVCSAAEPAQVADQFECTLVWMDAEPLLPGRPFLLKIGARTVGATVSAIKHVVNVNSGEHLAARTLELNAIGVCTLALDRPVAFDPYASNRETGGFILIDRMSFATAGAGMLHFALRRSQNLHLQGYDVDRAARAALLGQQPAVVWLTGLSGAGKSTLANVLAQRLHAAGRAAYVLDGDNLRHGLNRDLGFTDADRVENIRRVAEVARLMADAGLIVITAFISPFRSERALARSRMDGIAFVEVHVDTPLAVAEQRDPKGLYAKARRGELPHFTGIDSPYEAPESPELSIDTSAEPVDAAAQRVLEWLRAQGIVPA
jgi:bifunctional enzyme CysN/CysC